MEDSTCIVLNISKIMDPDIHVSIFFILVSLILDGGRADMRRHCAREEPAKEIYLGELDLERALGRLLVYADVPLVPRNPLFSGDWSVL